MRLNEAITLYVSRRRHQGSPFISTDVTLRAFCRYCGDLMLDEVNAEHINRFANMPSCAPSTRLSKFSAVKCFVEYFARRGGMPSLVLSRPLKAVKPRTPFIYTHSQVRSLLAAAGECQNRARRFDPKTLHLFLAMLYSTGTTVDEALTLRRCDWNFRSSRIRLGSQGGLIRPRVIPICQDLNRLIWEHVTRSASGTPGSVLLLTDSQGGAINRQTLAKYYRRVLSNTFIPKSIDGHTPRMQDFRFTFAVHRLDAWIRSGADLNKMIPALSAYMGYSSLTKAEQFLAFVPERFRADLDKLSEGKSGPRWAEDSALIGFLSAL